MEVFGIECRMQAEKKGIGKGSEEEASEGSRRGMEGGKKRKRLLWDDRAVSLIVGGSRLVSCSSCQR